MEGLERQRRIVLAVRYRSTMSPRKVNGGTTSVRKTPAEEGGAVLVNWEEIVRHTLVRVNRGDSTRLPNDTYCEPTLSRVFRRNRESGRELSVRRVHEDSESGPQARIAKLTAAKLQLSLGAPLFLAQVENLPAEHIDRARFGREMR